MQRLFYWQLTVAIAFVLGPAVGSVQASQSAPLLDSQVNTYDFENGTKGWQLTPGVWTRVPDGASRLWLLR